MAILLGRIEIDAARLWREHPPKIHDPKKRRLLELAGGLERSPAARPVVVTRWSPGEEARIGPKITTRSVDGPFTYPRAEEGVESWHVNFADPELFAFYGGPAFAQDEIQVAEHPLLASVRVLLTSGAVTDFPARTGDANRPTPVLVREVERWSSIDTNGIYGRRLGRASDEALKQAVTRLDDAPLSNILAIAAPRGMDRYSPEQIRDVIVTAATGFAAARAESPKGMRLRVVSGHWGTGAFGGNRVLMAAAQVLAARIARVDELVYYSLEDDGVDAFRKGLDVADGTAEGVTIDGAVDALHTRAFTWGRSDGN